MSTIFPELTSNYRMSMYTSVYTVDAQTNLKQINVIVSRVSTFFNKFITLKVAFDKTIFTDPNHTANYIGTCEVKVR